MIKLEDIKRRYKVKPKDWLKNSRINYIFTDLNNITSVFLYNFFFRLETREEVEEIIYLIDDKEEVSEVDIRTGYFVDKDKGRNKAEVIQERYSNTFSKSIYIVKDYTEFKKAVHLREDENVIIIGSGKDVSVLKDFYKNEQNHRIEKGITGGLLRINGYSKGQEVIVNMLVNSKNGTILGEQELEEIESERKTAKEIISENQLIGNSMLLFLNQMITVDAVIEGNQYSKWVFNSNTGEQKNTYFKKQKNIFTENKSRIQLYKYLVTEDEVEDFDKELQKYYDESVEKYNRKKVVRKVRKPQKFEEVNVFDMYLDDRYAQEDINRKAEEHKRENSVKNKNRYVRTILDLWYTVLEADLLEKEGKQLMTYEEESYKEKGILLTAIKMVLDKQTSKIEEGYYKNLNIEYHGRALVMYLEEKGYKISKYL